MGQKRQLGVKIALCVSKTRLDERSKKFQDPSSTGSGLRGDPWSVSAAPSRTCALEWSTQCHTLDLPSPPASFFLQPWISQKTLRQQSCQLLYGWVEVHLTTHTVRSRPSSPWQASPLPYESHSNGRRYSFLFELSSYWLLLKPHDCSRCQHDARLSFLGPSNDLFARILVFPSASTCTEISSPKSQPSKPQPQASGPRT